MNNNRYFTLQLKKAVRLYPPILAITVLLILCIALSAGLIINKNANDEEKKKMQIGITGDLSNTYLDAGITAVKNMDESRFSIEFVTLDENEAVSLLKKGKLTGFIRIPDNFVESIMKMENVPLVYVTSSAPQRFGSMLLYEVATTISDTVAETQRGIYGMQRLARDRGKTKGLSHNTDLLNIEYITSVLNRSNMVEIEYIGISGGLSLGAYFVCGGVMMFLLLWGISASSFLLKKDRSLETLLISKGQSPYSQAVCEYFSYLLMTSVTFLLFAFIGGTVFQSVKTGIPELDGSYLSHYILFAIGILPAIALIASLQFFLYEAVTGTVGTILLQFVYALGSGYICGCLYPSYFFPVSLQKIASLLPTGVGLSYMRGLMAGSATFGSLCGIFAYTLVFLLLSGAVRKHRNTGKVI